MQARTAFGWRLLAVSALIASTGCANPVSTASNTPAGVTRVAGDATGGAKGHSVTAVSDALGQRLDGMLSSRSADGVAGR